MKKISSLFARDPNNPRILTDVFHPDASWVVAGEGVATRKWDGTAVLVREGQLFARYDVKHGKVPPPGFEPTQDPDPNTGHHPGWVPALRPEDQWIQIAAKGTAREKIMSSDLHDGRGPVRSGRSPHDEPSRLCHCPTCYLLYLDDGTYEACGPKIGGNRERLPEHRLIRHGIHILDGVPRDKAGLVAYLSSNDVEGIVWWRRAGDDACDKIKITAAALGLRRGSR